MTTCPTAAHPSRLVPYDPGDRGDHPEDPLEVLVHRDERSDAVGRRRDGRHGSTLADGDSRRSGH